LEAVARQEHQHKVLTDKIQPSAQLLLLVADLVEEIPLMAVTEDLVVAVVLVLLLAQEIRQPLLHLKEIMVEYKLVAEQAKELWAQAAELVNLAVTGFVRQ
jgi:hypothetical protein